MLANGLTKHVLVRDEPYAIPALLSKALMFAHRQTKSAGDDLTGFPRFTLLARHDDVGMIINETGCDLPGFRTTGIRQAPRARPLVRYYMGLSMANQQD